MDIVGPTPHEDGFRMPARFARHERTYMAWPTVADYRPDLDRSRREYAAIAAAISEFEPVTLIVHPDDAAQPILEDLYPHRTVVPVESTAIAWDGGGVGCITQQQPAGRLAR